MNAPPQSAAEETAKLRQHFVRWDTFFFLVCTLVGVDGLGYGPQHGFHGRAPVTPCRPSPGPVALVPRVLFSLVGFELPSAAAEEMQDAAKDVPAGIGTSVVATGLLYGVPLLGILLVLPTSQANRLAGFPDTIRQSLTVFGGSVQTAADGTVTATLSGFGTGVGYVLGLLVAVVAFTSGLTWDHRQRPHAASTTPKNFAMSPPVPLLPRHLPRGLGAAPPRRPHRAALPGGRREVNPPAHRTGAAGRLRRHRDSVLGIRPPARTPVCRKPAGTSELLQ